jgi:hypothetical protein
MRFFQVAVETGLEAVGRCDIGMEPLDFPQEEYISQAKASFEEYQIQSKWINRTCQYL